MTRDFNIFGLSGDSNISAGSLEVFVPVVVVYLSGDKSEFGVCFCLCICIFGGECLLYHLYLLMQVCEAYYAD